MQIFVFPKTHVHGYLNRHHWIIFTTIKTIITNITTINSGKCTGIALVKTYGGRDERSSELEEALIERRPSEFLRDFTDFDQHDRIFQEFDPPESHEADPKAWRQSLPPFKTSLKECLKSVLLIQTVAGSIIGLLVVCIVILDFTFAEWCYNMDKQWDKMPRKVQSLRVTAQALEGAMIEMWDFTCIVSVFPLSLIKDLHLLTLNTLAAFIDMTYRLYLQMVGAYNAPWMSFPLNALFCMVILVNNYLLARHFYPLSLKNTMKLDFILSAQFILGLPAALMLVYGLFPWYIKQDQHIKVVIASASPLLTAIPKVVSRLGAQHLQGIIHPGTAHVLVAGLYAATAVVFRVMQSELSSFTFFVALGIAHAAIDLVERVTITMRDHIWEYLYRIIGRQRQSTPKYRSLRSRRFIADVTIQIMLQEATALISSLGFMTVYQALYSREKPFIDYEIIGEFFKRATVGLFIDLLFNTISLLIQTRVMNIAVIRVWKRKWHCHIVINTLLVSISVIYFSEYLLHIVQDKYGKRLRQGDNCTYPSFL
ncbi:hypothetical protein QZH41_020150 [Actinostola sp. cb2023]|nr:hypothetical protein QZH41_020150 [Actinostola sp. cb2023]